MNLQAARCPAAMSYVRSALNNAIESKFSGVVVISTIEQSMKRDLTYFVGTLDDVSIVSESDFPLSDKTRQEWLESGEAIKEDIEGIDNVYTFTVKVNSVV